MSRMGGGGVGWGWRIKEKERERMTGSKREREERGEITVKLHLPSVSFEAAASFGV